MQSRIILRVRVLTSIGISIAILMGDLIVSMLSGDGSHMTVTSPGKIYTLISTYRELGIAYFVGFLSNNSHECCLY